MGTLALAGDTMLGRGVAEHLATHPVRTLFGDELLEILAAADGMLLNLECCVSDRGEPWSGRLFHFRAPPRAVDALTLLDVRCVTLANNRVLDFGEQALLDTLEHLSAAGIAVAGAGESRQVARAPARIRIGDRAITVVSFTDHPAEYAATSDRPGVAYADLRNRVPGWLTETLQQLSATDTPLLVCPHWGPNMTRQPLPYIRRVASELRTAGATLIAGHSAHVFHGVDDRGSSTSETSSTTTPSIQFCATVLTGIAVEIREPKGLGRCRMAAVPDASAQSLHAFVTDHVEPGSTVIIDAWQGYRGIDKLGYVHDRRSQRAARARGEDPGELLPAVHRIASLIKRWLLGTHQGSTDVAHLPAYMNEFVFRFNRRRSHSRGMIFYRVLELAVDHGPVRYRDLVVTKQPGKTPPTPPSGRGKPPSLERPPANRPWRADQHFSG